MTTTDQKIEAVEEFLDWRENTDPTTSPDRLVERWRSVLEQADAATLLQQYRADAEFALAADDVAAAKALMERISRGV